MKNIIIFIILFIIFLTIFVTQAFAIEIRGEASYYSRAGCLGCSPGLIMANGEVLDDNRLTIALTPQTVRKYKLLNDYVGIINLYNLRWTIAKVTDTGGFARYNRVADLNLATKNAIGCKSLCNVIIIF